MICIIPRLKIDEKESVDSQYEIDYINFNDIVPNQYNGRKNINEILK